MLTAHHPASWMFKSNIINDLAWLSLVPPCDFYVNNWNIARHRYKAIEPNLSFGGFYGDIHVTIYSLNKYNNNYYCMYAILCLKQKGHGDVISLNNLLRFIKQPSRLIWPTSTLKRGSPSPPGYASINNYYMYVCLGVCKLAWYWPSLRMHSFTITASAVAPSFQAFKLLCNKTTLNVPKIKYPRHQEAATRVQW